MGKIMRRLLIFSLLALTAVAAETFAATRFTAGKRSSVVLIGSSNVAGWRCTGRSINANMEVAASIEKINDVIDRIANGKVDFATTDHFSTSPFQLEIPISAFRCTGGKRMEADMQKALRAAENPLIRFLLKDLRGGIVYDTSSSTYHADLLGQVSLGGKTREIEVAAKAQRLPGNRLILTVELPLHMSDFGIRPPTSLFGIIKAADALTVRFSLLLEAQESGS